MDRDVIEGKLELLGCGAQRLKGRYSEAGERLATDPGLWDTAWFDLQQWAGAIVAVLTALYRNSLIMPLADVVDRHKRGGVLIVIKSAYDSVATRFACYRPRRL